MTDPCFILDGKPIPFNKGETVFTAARRAGVAIPSLCWDNRLEGAGHCRLCVVKVAGRRIPTSSCTLTPEPGMKITAFDEELTANRRALLEMVLSENPDTTCPRCRVLGTCELHALAQSLGVRRGRFAGATSQAAKADDNPFIARDYSLCISCYRCTRICAEVEGDFAIAPAGRGFLTRIATAGDGLLKESSCTFCGQCVQTCPTGALSDRKFQKNYREEAGPVTATKSVCTYCGTGCVVHLHTQEGKLIGVTPDMEGPANEGALCVKGQFGLDFVNSGDRLKYPMIRKNGTLVRASWDEALDAAADRLKTIRDTRGKGAVYAIASGRTSNESNYLMQKWMRTVIGTNNVDNCARG